MTIQPISQIQSTPTVLPIESVVGKELPAQSDLHKGFSEGSSQATKQEETLKQPAKKEVPLHQTVKELNEKLLGRDMKMQFKIHQRTGYTIVKLVDMQTGRVIKEIPPENMLNVIGKIWDDMGIAIDRKG